MLGNHPFAWFITFAFFYEVFKEHKQRTKSLEKICVSRLVSIKMLTSSPNLLKMNLVEDNGIEPLTPCVQGRCSPS